jgi:hypothetical protein
LAVSNIDLIFPIINWEYGTGNGMSSSQLTFTHSMIFQRGRSTTNPAMPGQTCGANLGTGPCQLHLVKAGILGSLQRKGWEYANIVGTISVFEMMCSKVRKEGYER